MSSFDEVRQVLCDHGIMLGIKVIRKLTYRYAERARAEQQAGRIPLNDGDTLEGRRVVISTDGGHTRLDHSMSFQQPIDPQLRDALECKGKKELDHNIGHEVPIRRIFFKKE